MDLSELGRGVILLLALLNPFLMSIYLLDLIRQLSAGQFLRVLTRGAMISLGVFSAFAVTGDAFFTSLFHVHFASFQIFGGIVFLIIGIRFVLMGEAAITSLRGPAEHVAGSIALPFMIGPGTVTASIIVGEELPILLAVSAIVVSLTCTVLTVQVLKVIHDLAARRNQLLVERYIDIVGRMSAFLIGTLAVEMISSGLHRWLGMGSGFGVPE